MKRQILHFIFSVFFGSIFLTACFDDKGNYDYIQLSNFYVDTAGMEAIPMIAQFDTLKLNSKLVYDGDKSNLIFKWSLYDYSPGFAGNPEKVISTTENLATPVTVFPSDYWLEFRAIESQTGRVAAYRYKISVGTSGSGLLVLYEKDNIVDCDLIKTKLLTGTLEHDDVARQIYSQSNPDHPLTGKAVSINMFNYSNMRYISIYTDNDGVNISADDISVIKNFQDMFLFAPRNAKPEGYLAPYGVLTTTPGETSDGVEILVSNGICYFSWVMYAILTNTQPIYSERTLATNVSPNTYYAAPFPFYGLGSLVVYDQENMRFLSGSPLVTTLSVVVGSGNKFSFGNIGKKLIYIGYGFNGAYMMYGIFKNPSDNGERFLYVMNFGPNNAVAKWDISNYENIRDATLFAFGRRGPLAYYAVHNKVYQIKFDLNADAVDPAPVNGPVFPANEEISCIKLCPYPGRDVEENTRDRYLFVGTYNESTEEGKLYIYRTNITSGACDPEPVSVFGQFGKIKDVAFKF
ncbi:MAG: hypothetical protein LBT50_06735 [Prevotellaceae bacterium]|nr:hypothetical protein [Prevotellaceae bacterium]